MLQLGSALLATPCSSALHIVLAARQGSSGGCLPPQVCGTGDWAEMSVRVYTCSLCNVNVYMDTILCLHIHICTYLHSCIYIHTFESRQALLTPYPCPCYLCRPQRLHMLCDWGCCCCRRCFTCMLRHGERC